MLHSPLEHLSLMIQNFTEVCADTRDLQEHLLFPGFNEDGPAWQGSDWI